MKHQNPSVSQFRNLVNPSIEDELSNNRRDENPTAHVYMDKTEVEGRLVRGARYAKEFSHKLTAFGTKSAQYGKGVATCGNYPERNAMESTIALKANVPLIGGSLTPTGGPLHGCSHLNHDGQEAHTVETLQAIKSRLHELEHAVNSALTECHGLTEISPASLLNFFNATTSSEHAKESWEIQEYGAGRMYFPGDSNSIPHETSESRAVGGQYQDMPLDLDNNPKDKMPGSDIDNLANEQIEWQDFFDLATASLQQDLLSHALISPQLEDPPSMDFNLSTANASQQTNVGTQTLPTNNGPIRRNFQCSHCMKSFSRPSDRDRHARSHNPNAHRHSCPAIGCDRVGNKGFLRKDKLAQHREHRRH